MSLFVFPLDCEPLGEGWCLIGPWMLRAILVSVTGQELDSYPLKDPHCWITSGIVQMCVAPQEKNTALPAGWTHV